MEARHTRRCPPKNIRKSGSCQNFNLGPFRCTSSPESKVFNHQHGKIKVYRPICPAKVAPKSAFLGTFVLLMDRFLVLWVTYGVAAKNRQRREDIKKREIDVCASFLFLHFAVVNSARFAHVQTKKMYFFHILLLLSR